RRRRGRLQAAHGPAKAGPHVPDKPAVSRFHYTAPERLQFREGGGCLSLFGTPFLLAGVFMLISVAGVVPINGGGPFARPLLGLMGLAFTGVGGALVLGRAWTVL